MIAVPCIVCAKCHRVCYQKRLRNRHSQGLYIPSKTNQNSLDDRSENHVQSMKIDENPDNVNTSTIHSPVITTRTISSTLAQLNSSQSTIDQIGGLETQSMMNVQQQTADIHWLPSSLSLANQNPDK